MANSYITNKGKVKMLELAFVANSENNFNYLALGGAGSAGVASEDIDAFQEVSGDGYTRVPLTLKTDETGNTSITLTGSFDEDNYAPASGGAINEIAIINSKDSATEETIFAIIEVPEIYKRDNVSIDYDIVISLD